MYLPVAEKKKAHPILFNATVLLERDRTRMFFVHILLQEFQIGFYFEVESSQEMQCVHSVQAVVHQKHIDRANSCLFLHFLTADHFEQFYTISGSKGTRRSC